MNRTVPYIAKTVLAGCLIMGLPASAFAAEADGGKWLDFSSLGTAETLMLILGVMAFFVIIGAMLTIQKAVKLMAKEMRRQHWRQQGIDEGVIAKIEEGENAESPGFFSSLQDAVPVSKEKDIMFDHAYDGIRELDNNLPPWWVYMFYLTIAWGCLYFAYYHVAGFGLTQAQAYEVEMEAAAERARLAEAGRPAVDENTVTALTGEGDLQKGEAIFKQNCVTCHGTVGQGMPAAPNLTDKYWLHGGGIKNIFSTIKYGVVEKGMISWQAQLSPDQIQQVASYIHSLQGSNPPGAKEPQGELYEEASTEDAATGDAGNVEEGQETAGENGSDAAGQPADSTSLEQHQ